MLKDRRSRLKSMLSAEIRDQKGFPFLRLVCYLAGLGVTIISVVLSVYAQVFSQDSGSFWEHVKGPSQEVVAIEDVISAARPRETSISDGDHLDDEQSGVRRLLVFALDVSGSLDSDLDPREEQLYRQRIAKLNYRTASTCLESLEVDNVSRWQLAKTEVCCMLERVPDGSHVGLWVFGTRAKHLTEWPYWWFKYNENYQVENYQVVADALLNQGLDPKKDPFNYRHTDFSALLNGLRYEYIDNAQDAWDEIHFVIVSDFLQDTDLGEPLKEYSARQIQARFRELSQRNVTFHLSSFSPGIHDISSVVRLAQEDIEWFRYRVDQAVTAEPRAEFLHFFSFRPTDYPIRFFHQVGSDRVSTVRLMMRSAETADKSVVVGLMKDAYSRQHDDLVLRVVGSKSEKCPSTWEETGDLARSADLLRVTDQSMRILKDADDYLCLQPLSAPQIGGAEYRLTIADVSLNGATPHEARKAQRVTVVARVEFVKYIPGFALQLLTAGSALVLLPALVVCGWLSMLWRRAGKPRSALILGSSDPSLVDPTVDMASRTAHS